MPNWNPNWNDVRWDHAAASEAASTLHDAATRLESSAAQRENLGGVALDEWRGRYGDEFRTQLRSLINEAYDIAREYRSIANRIMSASEEARDEQRRRERAREAWREEKREEKRRDREREERRRSSYENGGW